MLRARRQEFTNSDLSKGQKKKKKWLGGKRGSSTSKVTQGCIPSKGRESVVGGVGGTSIGVLELEMMAERGGNKLKFVLPPIEKARKELCRGRGRGNTAKRIKTGNTLGDLKPTWKSGKGPNGSGQKKP